MMQSDRNVLIVEDDVDVQAVLAELFIRKSIQARFAGDGETALECARLAWSPIVVLDLTLAGELDGWQVWGALRDMAGGRALQVILFTACLGAGEESRAAEWGAFGVVQKPVSVRRMMAELERAARSLAM